MESSKWRRFVPMHIGNVVIVLAFVLVIAVVLLAAFRPNRSARLFERAQQLEAAGQWKQAVGHYHLLVETEPHSNLAPRALMQQAVILEGMARRSGEDLLFQDSIDAYKQVAQHYPDNALAGQALLAGADLAMSDLNDYEQAATLYQQILDDFPRNLDYASQATLAMGRIALARRDASSAQKYFAHVLDTYKMYPDRCAEAQYQLGVVAETLAHRPENAKEAYQQTIKNYPTSVWAANAKERLGMLFYGDIAPGGPARRVMIQLKPLPDTGYANNSPFLPLALVLSARGMEIGPASLQAWSLQPFVAGFDAEKPGHIVQAQKGFENAVANAGLRFNTHNENDASKAFDALRQSVDQGKTPVAYIGKWVLVAGYDTVSQLIFTQSDGAQIINIPVKEFLDLWGKSKPHSGIVSSKPYTFLSFQSDADQPKSTEYKKAAQQDNHLFVTPSFELTLTPLSRKNADRRTIRRAAALLQRAHFNNALLNIEALSQLADDVAMLGTPPPSPIPVPEEETENATPENPASGGVNWQMRIKRAEEIAPWFGEPLQAWIENRRDAATYLESIAQSQNNNQLKEAANDLRRSITALQNAANNFPRSLKTGSVQMWSVDLGKQLRQTAQYLREARDAESHAAKLMKNAVERI